MSGVFGQGNSIAHQAQDLDVVVEDEMGLVALIVDDLGAAQDDVLADFHEDVFKLAASRIALRDQISGHGLSSLTARPSARCHWSIWNPGAPIPVILT
jgi:hypothetical protein